MATPILTITLNNTNNNNRLNVDVQASETKFEIPDLQSANGGDYLNLIKNILQTLYVSSTSSSSFSHLNPDLSLKLLSLSYIPLNFASIYNTYKNKNMSKNHSRSAFD